MRVHWISLVYGLALILVWPMTAFVWALKIKKWRVSKALGSATSAGVLSIIAGIPLADFFQFHFGNEKDASIVEILPMIWLVIPLLSLLTTYIFSRKKNTP